MPLMRRVAALGAAVAAARRYARRNPDQVNRYADQAASFVDRKTGGRYRRQLDSAVRQVRKETGVPGRASGFGESGDSGDSDRSRPRYPSRREDRPFDGR